MRWTIPLLFVACGVDGPPPTHTSFPSCEEISLACHNVDVASDGGPGEECHVLSHVSRTEEACAAKKTECLTYCSGDGGIDGGDQ